MEVDQALLKEVEDKILPFIEEIENKYTGEFNKVFMDDFSPKITTAFNMQFHFTYFFVKTQEASRKLSDPKFLLERDKAQLTLFEHLMLAEGLFDRILGLLCLFGIWDGNDFITRINHQNTRIESVEDINRTYTWEKINFLINCNDDFELLKRYRFKEIRNAIAHCDYRVLHDGNIIFTSQDFSEELSYLEIQEYNAKIKDICMAINEVLKMHYKKYEEYAKKIFRDP